MVASSILAGELRRDWVDNHQVAAEDFDDTPGIRVCCETDLQGLAESPLA